MNTLVICWNVSRVPWFLELEKALQSLEPSRELKWVAVSRAEHIRLRLDGIKAPLLSKVAAVEKISKIVELFSEDEWRRLLYYEAALSNAPDFNQLLNQAKRLVSWYDQHFDDTNPSSLVCVNGWRMHTSAAVAVARKREVPVLFIENGYLPHTTVADPRGVNYAGSLTTMPLTNEVDSTALATLLDRYHAGDLNKPASVPGWKEYLARGLSATLATLTVKDSGFLKEEMTLHEAYESWKGESRRRGAKLDCGEIRKPYVFFPMQVEDDSQLLIHSPWIKSMEHAISEVLKALPPGVQLVVKRHPSDRGRTPLGGIRELLKNNGGAFISSGSMNELLPEAVAVVTINSTVGFEALTWYRPVVVLGQAPYAGRGATYEAASSEQLSEVLRKAISLNPDREKIERLLYTTLFKYTFNGGWKDPRYTELSAIASTIINQERLP